MKKPQDRGTAIDLKRYKAWVEEFSGFRHQIPEGRIRDWLASFSDDDHDVIARILDCVDFITYEQMANAFRTALGSIEGWDRVTSRRTGKWRFVAYSASAGESGDQMLSKFRHANNLAGNNFNDLFIYRSDLLREDLGFDDTVVLVDDFAGTGDQVCHSWDNIYGELLAEVGRVFLILVAGVDDAVKRINDETDLTANAHIQFTDADNFFHSKCKWFKTEEKEGILEYCTLVDEAKPKGHGECGLLVVFSHTVPNNTIPILQKRTDDWEPLFCRYD